jgi:type II secretory pathway predicted ATPase ExeA
MPRDEARDRPSPFAEGAGPFVAGGPHARAVAAIADAMTSGERLLRLEGAAGAGKSRVAEALARSWREPGRRVALVDAGTGASVADGLARALGGSAGPLADGAGWSRLAELARLARVQRGRIVLVVDGAERLPGDADLDRLLRLDPRGGSPIAVLVASRSPGRADGPDPLDDRAFAVRLPAMTRSEAADYLAAKLTAGGRDPTAIEPGAVARLHAASRGLPRALDRLARRALAAAGDRPVTAADIAALLDAEDAAAWAA